MYTPPQISAMPLQLVLISPLLLGTTHVAIVGKSFDGGTHIDSLAHHVTTPWTLVDAANATQSEIAAAAAFIEAPVEMLGAAGPAANLYQFFFTGIPPSMIAPIPPRFAVANCHQSSVAIAEYVMAHVLSWTVGLQRMDSELRRCTWKTAPPGNNCSRAERRHRQASNLTIGILGYGHIGEAIAERAAPFGSKVIATTLNPPSKPPAPLAWIGDDSSNPRLFAE